MSSAHHSVQFSPHAGDDDDGYVGEWRRANNGSTCENENENIGISFSFSSFFYYEDSYSMIFLLYSKFSPSTLCFSNDHYVHRIPFIVSTKKAQITVTQAMRFLNLP